MGPLGGVEGANPEALTVNAKKHRWWAPWEVPDGDPRAPTIKVRNIDDGPSCEVPVLEI
jgi:hypothetical protein